MSKTLYELAQESIELEDTQNLNDAIEMLKRELVWVPVLKERVGKEKYDCVLEKKVKDGYGSKEYYEALWEFANDMRFVSHLVNRIDDDTALRFWADCCEEWEDADEVYNEYLVSYQKNSSFADNIKGEILMVIDDMRYGYNELAEKAVKELIAPELTETDVEAIKAGVPMEDIFA